MDLKGAKNYDCHRLFQKVQLVQLRKCMWMIQFIHKYNLAILMLPAKLRVIQSEFFKDFGKKWIIFDRSMVKIHCSGLLIGSKFKSLSRSNNDVNNTKIISSDILLEVVINLKTSQPSFDKRWFSWPLSIFFQSKNRLFFILKTYWPVKYCSRGNV